MAFFIHAQARDGRAFGQEAQSLNECFRLKRELEEKGFDRFFFYNENVEKEKGEEPEEWVDDYYDP